jgi:hypothetical protein
VLGARPVSVAEVVLDDATLAEVVPDTLYTS